jgi:hypothetical protein
MNPHERLEFFYSEQHAFAAAGVFLLLGFVFFWINPGFALLLAIFGVWYLSKAFDRRPVIVVDSEGVFYRPRGKSDISWHDIRAVKCALGMAGHRSILLIRHSGRRVNMHTQLLPHHQIYDAIVQAWQSHGGASRRDGLRPGAVGYDDVSVTEEQCE